MNNEQAEKQTAENGSAERRGEHGQFSEGNPGGPGRPKGMPSKVNAALKDDILAAYEQRGGIEWLRALKDRDFVGLLQRTMPKEISADVRAVDQRPVMISVIHVDTIGANGRQLDAAENALAGNDLDAAQDQLPFLEKLIAQHAEEFPLAVAEHERAKAIQARIIQATGMMNQ